MLATLLIVFREVIEAGLIVGIVLAATKGVTGRGLWVSYGVLGGVLARLWSRPSPVSSARCSKALAKLFNAVILLVAVIMLGWHNMWMASHGRALAQEMKEVGAAVSSGQKPLAALAIVCGIAVLREGSEVVLFLYGIFASGGTSKLAMLVGGLLGLVAGAALSALMYLGLVTIPTRYLFSFTSGLITLLAAGLAAQAVNFLQQAGYLDVLTATVWDSSWLLPEDSLLGRLLHTLIGYTDRPSGAQLVAYVLTVAVIVGLMRWTRAGNTVTAARTSSSTATPQH